jgi:hypothetical protein
MRRRRAGFYAAGSEPTGPANAGPVIELTH